RRHLLAGAEQCVLKQPRIEQRPLASDTVEIMRRRVRRLIRAAVAVTVPAVEHVLDEPRRRARVVALFEAALQGERVVLHVAPLLLMPARAAAFGHAVALLVSVVVPPALSQVVLLFERARGSDSGR